MKKVLLIFLVFCVCLASLVAPVDGVGNEGTSLADFENTRGWIVSGNGKIESDATHYYKGAKSLKLSVTTAGSSVNADKKTSVNMQKKNKVIRIWCYLYTDPNTVSNVEMFFTSSPWGKYFKKSWKGTTLHQGPNLLAVNVNEWAKTGNESWANAMVRFRVKVNARAGQKPVVSFDDCRYGTKSVTRCVICFDDAWSSASTEGLAYMNSKGLKGTIYVVPKLVDKPGYMSSRELDDAYAKGWALGNHTIDHADLSALATRSEIKDKINQCTEWLNSRGYFRASQHLAYPIGNYNNEVLAVVSDLGLKTGRAVLRRNQLTPLDDYRQLTVQGISGALKDARGYVDSAINTESTCILVFHKLVTTPEKSIEWSITDFKVLIDYIVANKIQVMTIDEYYNELNRT